jgi:hypothetical protein
MARLNFYGHMCNFMMRSERLANASGGERRVVRDQRQRRGKRLSSYSPDVEIGKPRSVVTLWRFQCFANLLDYRMVHFTIE